MNKENNKTGILLVGHGSRLKYNKELVTEVARKYALTMPDYNVEVGFMELVEPSIPQSFNKLKETGVNKIIVNPVFLAHGMHTKIDIPTILGLGPLVDLENHPHHHHNHNHEHHHHHHRDAKSEPVEFDGEIIYLEPLGADDKIVDIITDRINNELEKNPTNPPENTGILLIGHGSTLPYNNEVIESIAKKYISQNKDYPIEVGFMQLSKPTILESFDKLKEKGVKKVIACPIFLAHGIHTKLDIPHSLGLNPEPIKSYPKNYDNIDVVEFDGEIILTEPIDANDSIIDIISERINPHL
ncbi:sirohydrochlorin nickelochelatase [Methanosphaera sp. WGK6]|uniref:sirohydrochlorin nickelochelatase n=1 Tax=Methanosphaera sp. WGK6 TaxID=1561964 RepID=UPI00084CDD3B|nr:sirohydrochlorin nickelochelatase [Methanosphaera sp. WGK6]